MVGGQVESIKIKGSTIDIRNTATLAFQRLWNRNNLGAQIAEDGDYGPNTESKLRVSPANGFKIAPWDKKPRLLRLSQPRMEGSDVERLQTAAVKEFQATKTLTADGIVGRQTLGAMA